MILNIYEEEGINIFFSYSPGWELFFSMHVLSNPEHHGSRRKWCIEKGRQIPLIVDDIKKLKEITDSWLFLIDSPFWREFRQMEVAEMLAVLRKKNIYQWNDMLAYSGKHMSIQERDNVLGAIEAYYSQGYKNEEQILRYYLKKAVTEEQGRLSSMGLWQWCKNVHPRLLVEKEALIYRKNHEFRILKKDIRKIFLSVSTFVDPHLWLYFHECELEVVKGVEVEQKEMRIPEDTLLLLKALGDSTRLQLIRLLIHGIHTTKELSNKLGVSEACVSKHLKILYTAGFVDKLRNGTYMEYSFKLEKLDFIPYILCETILK